LKNSISMKWQSDVEMEGRPMSECFNLCHSMEYHASVIIAKYPCNYSWELPHSFDSIKRRKWNFFIFSLRNGHCVSFHRESFYFLYAFYFFTFLFENFARLSLSSTLSLSHSLARSIVWPIFFLVSYTCSSSQKFHLFFCTRNFIFNLFISLVLADKLQNIKIK
jgi:hypothetical protein